MKNKSKDFSNLPISQVKPQDFGLNKESFVRQAVNFLRENDVLSDYDINSIIISTYMASEKIKNVELIIDKEAKIVFVSAFLGRFNYIFSNKNKIINQIVTYLQPIVSKSYSLNIEVKLQRYDKKEK